MNFDRSVLGALCFVLAAACGNSSGKAERDDAVGTLSAGLSASLAHDVAAVHYAVVQASQTCADAPLAETTVALEDETLPGSVQPTGGGADHGFSDALFTLAPGEYMICATPLSASGTPSAECAQATGVGAVFEGSTTEVLLISQCNGEGNGGLDVVTVLNDAPLIDNVSVAPSKFITSCEEVQLTASVTDPNGDAVSYVWSSDGPISGTGNVATFGPASPGDYTATLTVTDVYGGTSSISIPVHVTPGDCNLVNCRTVNDVQWCYNPNTCGEACEDVCTSLGLSLTISNEDWFAAQDSVEECQALNDAFELGGTVSVESYTYACIEDYGGTHTAPGGLIGPLLCSTYSGCPQEHRTTMDQQGISCDSTFSSRRSLCPCN